jgi:hypothetical protein
VLEGLPEFILPSRSGSDAQKVLENPSFFHEANELHDGLNALAILRAVRHKDVGCGRRSRIAGHQRSVILLSVMG